MILSVKNRKGKKIHCIVDFRGKNKRLRGVLLVHGFKGFATERHLEAISNALVDAGFLTLRPDLTKNPGKSYLPFEDMTYTKELSDLEDVFDQFIKLPEIDSSKLGIAGHSLGGLLAAQLASKRREVKSLATLSAVFDFGEVAEKAFKKPFDEFRRDFEENGWTYVWSQSLNRNLVINETFWKGAMFKTAADFAAKITCPTLVVSSGSDESVSQFHADRYFENISSKIKEMKIINSADHIYSGQALARVCKEVSEWFEKTL